MSRLIRSLLPASLCVLLTSAIIVACRHHDEAPAAPRPEPVTPSGEPATTAHPGYGTPGQRDAGSGASLTPAPPSSDSPLSSAGGAAPETQLASQPTVPLPGGDPSQPTVPPPVEPPPQPGVPLQPSRPPAIPTTPGAPTRPTLPGAPPQPSTPAAPIGGISDAGSPRLPSALDGGIPGDSGMQPILGRDR